MKLPKLELPKAWRTYRTFALFNGASVVLLLCGFQFHYQHAQAAHQQRQQLQALQARHHELHIKQADIKKYLPQYHTLIAQGFVGQEQRSLWIEQLKQRQQAHQLFPITYSIAARQAFPESATNIQAIQLYHTQMKLDMDLLHEGDLLQLLESLKASHIGTFILHECKINQLSTFNAMNQTRVPNLHAECVIDWFTMAEKLAQQADTQ